MVGIFVNLLNSTAFSDRGSVFHNMFEIVSLDFLIRSQSNLSRWVHSCWRNSSVRVAFGGCFPQIFGLVVQLPQVFLYPFVILFHRFLWKIWWPYCDFFHLTFIRDNNSFCLTLIDILKIFAAFFSILHLNIQVLKFMLQIPQFYASFLSISPKNRHSFSYLWLLN